MNDTLFQIEMVPKWSERVVHFLTTTEVKSLGDTAKEQVDFMLSCSRFQMIAYQLYYLGQDNLLRLVAYPKEYNKL